ncbi:MAG: recombinase family protein [Clostridia bacterium]|nr:recombinase family protein [Clostridia bacterium]
MKYLKNEEKRVVIYCRESRDDYGENYERIETQRDLLVKFCENKGLNNIIEIIMDDNKSGTNFNRFNQIKNKAKNGEFDVIVFKNSARMGRNQREALNLVQYLENCQIEIVFEDELYDEELFGLYAWFNERRARDDSKNIKRNLRHKIEEGKLTIKPIYGYDKVDGEVVINPNTAPIVKKIFYLYNKGLTFYDLIEYLNKNNIPTPSESRQYPNCRKALKWNRQHITRILKDRRYTGDYVGGKTEKVSFKSNKIRMKDENEWIIITNHHESIISKDLFNEVCQKLKTSKSIV